jgi:hypothetical protein
MRTTSLRHLCVLYALAGCDRGGLPPATEPPAALDSACSFAAGADPTKAVLAFTVDHDVKYTFADGSTRTVYTFATQLPSPSTSFIGRVDDVQGDRVLADGSTLYEPEGAPAQYANELVLLNLKGQVVWHQAAPEFGTPYLSTDGTLAVWDTNEETLVVGPDGSVRTLAGWWSPIAPAPDGSLLVQKPPSAGDGHLGWLRPGQTDVQMLAIQPAGYEQWIADRIAYVGQQNGTDVLVLATPDDAQIVPLPGGSGDGLSIMGVAGDWLAVQRYVTTTATTVTTLRVNVRTGTADVITEQAPSGMRGFDAAGELSAPQIADDGSLISAFRDDYIGGAYRSTDAGASWAPFGLTVANVQGLALIAASGGTFVLQSVQSTWAPDSPWSTPPAGVTPDLSGAFIQIARPADGVKLQLTSAAGYKPIALGSAGRCAAYWVGGPDKKGGQLEALDVLRGRRSSLAQTADVSGINPPLWLER